MSKTNPNDLATPCYWNEAYACFYTQIHKNGSLTKREHFAAMAMQGLLSNQTYLSDVESADEIAKEAVILAGALINALNQETK